MVYKKREAEIKNQVGKVLTENKKDHQEPKVNTRTCKFKPQAISSWPETHQLALVKVSTDMVKREQDWKIYKRSIL